MQSRLLVSPHVSVLTVHVVQDTNFPMWQFKTSPQFPRLDPGLRQSMEPANHDLCAPRTYRCSMPNNSHTATTPAGKRTATQMYALCPQATLKARPGKLQKPTINSHPSGTPSKNDASALTKVIMAYRADSGCMTANG